MLITWSPIYKKLVIYRKIILSFIVRSTYDTELQRVKISLVDILS